MLRVAAALAVLLATALLAGCGGDDEQPAGAAQLLSRAFEAPVESGRLSATVELQLDGVDLFRDGLEVRVTGPFTRRAVDLDVSLGGLGPGGGLTVTEDNLWVSFLGRAYELGERRYAQLERGLEEKTGQDASSLSLKAFGIDVAAWLRDARIDGEERVAGEQTTKVVARLDPARVLGDLAELATRSADAPSLPEEDREALAGLVEDSTVEVYVSNDDGTLRRLALELEFEVPAEVRSQFGGVEGGAAAVDVTLTEVGRPQRIEPPSDARPLDDLLRRFGLSAESLLR